MNEHVHWMLTIEIREGQLEAFKALMDEMVPLVKEKETGTLNYEWYLSEDETLSHIHERFADSEAVMTHLKTFAQFAGRFMAIVKPLSQVVYGNPSDQVRQSLAMLNPVYMAPLGGFTR